MLTQPKLGETDAKILVLDDGEDLEREKKVKKSNKLESAHGGRTLDSVFLPSESQDSVTGQDKMWIHLLELRICVLTKTNPEPKPHCQYCTVQNR